MKVLVLSDTPWSVDNSFGNSFSNIFDGMEDLQFANIYCRPEQPNNTLDMTCFQITEKALIKNLLNASLPTGKIVCEDFASGEDLVFSQDLKLRTFGAKKRWQILFWARDFLWKIGRWKSVELIDFIDNFSPDIIFQPVYYSSYLNDIAQFIKKHTDAPMIGYISDDNYTLRQFSLSPLYWIDRLWKRQKVKKTIEQCELLYVISQIQKEEYEKIFTPPCKVLTKCADFFDDKKPTFKQPDETLKMVYAGNISRGRFRILANLVEEIRKLNADRVHLYLDIYTSTPLSAKQVNQLNVHGASQLHPPVSYAEIRDIQMASDILVHAEAFDLREKLAVHQSFSTKIVDYLASNRCILAIGDRSCASIRYCLDNDCAVVAQKPQKMRGCLTALIEDHALLQQYANKAWESGKRHHQRVDMQKMLYEEICKIVKEDRL